MLDSPAAPTAIFALNEFVSEAYIPYMGGLPLIVGMVKALVQEYKVTVPVALHLDHGSSFEVCLRAMHAGFTSVMIDASH